MSSADQVSQEARIGLRQEPRILQIYNLYRIVLAVVLLLTFLTSASTTNLGSHDPALFQQVTIGYTIFSFLVALVVSPAQRFENQETLVASLFIVDIIVIAILTYTCGGVISGLGLLLLVTIASGGILVRGRLSTFLAAIASIAIIYSEVYLTFTSDSAPGQYLQAGLLGALLFATSLYLQALADRMRRGAVLAEQQASSIIGLEKLNHLIIQRMRTGIVVVDNNGEIVTRNSTANHMLHLKDSGQTENQERSGTLPEILQQQLAQWKLSPTERTPPFRMSKSGPSLQAYFALLNYQPDSDILVFLEDNSQLIQRVRQMKLVSLGRLTASIAHEIRNPLGAISHAGQLLSESTGLDTPDQRLSEIILTHCDRVNRIIEDILHVSRQSESPSVKINLQDWLSDFIRNYRETHQVSGEIVMDVNPPDTTVRVITSQFEQVLNNLFENGLRYSREMTGKASLTLKGGLSGAPGNELPYLHIIDEGKGIAQESEEKLFEPFYTTESSGTGLGLYISRELCEANQAHLSYKRTDAGKSCFRIHFSHPDRNVI